MCVYIHRYRYAPVFLMERVLVKLENMGTDENVAHNMGNQGVRMRGKTKREHILSNQSR